MKKCYHWVFYLAILGIVVWGLVTPSGIRGAWANNVWSINFVKYFYDSPNQATEIQPAPDSHLHAGLFQLNRSIKENDYSAALKYLQPLVESSDPIALETYARIHYQLGNYSKAFSSWQKVGNSIPILDAYATFLKSRQMDLVILSYDYLYAMDPELHTAQYSYWLFDQKKYGASIHVLNESIQNFPNSPERPKWLRLLGENYRVQQKWSEAESVYLQLIGEKPDEWKAWRSLGLLYYDRDNNLEKTRESFERAINIDPENAEIHATLAKDFLIMKQNELAIEQMEIALDLLDTVTIGYLLEAGQIFEWSGLPEKALDMYKLALKQDPINPTALDGIKRISGN